jgi:biopolymer transport protein ExbD
VPKKKRAEPPVEVTLPITPMLDMSFQLLSFFILTFHPMPQEGQLAINLPKPEAANVNQAEQLPDDENKKDEYVVQVHSSSGDIELLSLQGPAAKREAMKFNDLQDELKRIPLPSGKGQNGVSITIEASDKLNYSRLIDVMNLCKFLGYENIGISRMRRGN